MILLKKTCQYFFIILIMTTHQVLHSSAPNKITYHEKSIFDQWPNTHTYQHITPQQIHAQFQIGTLANNQDFILKTEKINLSKTLSTNEQKSTQKILESSAQIKTNQLIFQYNNNQKIPNQLFQTILTYIK